MCLLSLREAWDQRLAQTYTLPNIALYCMNYILGVHPTHDPMCIIASLRLMPMRWDRRACCLPINGLSLFASPPKCVPTPSFFLANHAFTLSPKDS